MVIAPSIGKVVWFYVQAMPRDDDQPHAALVAFVHNDRLVNLACFDENGQAYRRTSVQLVQEGDAAPGGAHCRWMPYQLGQAKKAVAPPETSAFEPKS